MALRVRRSGIPESSTPSALFSVPANLARKTRARSRPSTPTTGSSFQRSRRTTGRSSSSASPRPVASAMGAPRSVASWFRRPSTRSRASDSSSIKIDIRSIVVRRVCRLAGVGVAMTLPPELSRRLSRIEEARRQTQRQLDMVGRQITRRMTALIPGLLPRRTCYRGGRAPDPGAFLERYRAQLAAPTTERQPEIDDLSRKLARQDQAIARFLDQHRHAAGGSERV